MPTLKLETAEKDIVVIDVELAKHIRYLEIIMAFRKKENKNNNDVIPLHNIKSNILYKILDWVEYHKNDDEPEKHDLTVDIGDDWVNFHENDDEPEKHDLTVDIAGWDLTYLDVETELLFEIIHASVELYIFRLYKMSRQTILNRIEGKTIDEMRDILGLEDI